MTSITVNVKNEVWKALEKQGKDFIDLTISKLDKISQTAEKTANALLNDAKYDGSLEDVTITREADKSGNWRLIMSGPAALAIEYGATSNGPNDYWFFSGKGRKIMLKAGGHRAYYTRVLRHAYSTEIGVRYDRAAKRHKQYITKNYNAPRRERDVRKLAFGDVEKRYIGVRDAEDKTKVVPIAKYIPVPKWRTPEGKGAGYALEKVPKPDSYFTRGNPPNNVLQKTFEQIVEEVEKL